MEDSYTVCSRIVEDADPYNAPPLRVVEVAVGFTVRFRIVEDADPYGLG